MSSARLVVVVPRTLSFRMGSLGDRLQGSGIEVVLDRRTAVRRRLFEGRTEERRHEDRRGHQQLVGYVFGCSIVRIEEPPEIPTGVAVHSEAAPSPE